MSFGATDIPVQREREVLAGLESKLSDAMARRGKITQDIQPPASRPRRPSASTPRGIRSVR
jgi:hypothetical protein